MAAEKQETHQQMCKRVAGEMRRKAALAREGGNRERGRLWDRYAGVADGGKMPFKPTDPELTLGWHDETRRAIKSGHTIDPDDVDDDGD